MNVECSLKPSKQSPMLGGHVRTDRPVQYQLDSQPSQPSLRPSKQPAMLGGHVRTDRPVQYQLDSTSNLREGLL
jgi:hypothetical protein